MITQASRLKGVRYDIRGPVLRRAQELEAEGRSIIKLNIGNPAPWGLHAPDSVMQAMVQNLPDAQGYSDARGIYSARLAVAQRYQGWGLDVDPDDVFLGNGVSELIAMCMQALLNPGDEVLIPAPDYPLWTGAVTLCGGTALHYRCIEEEGWQPDLEHLEASITSRTKALVIINPNNPTGAVYSERTLRGMLDIARRHHLLVFCDEIYDQILYDGRAHVCAATLAPDLLIFTMSGLSKTHRAAGLRAGWAVISGPRHQASDYLEGLQLLANMRLCPNVPSQHAIQTALGGAQSIQQLVAPGGRLRDQRDFAWARLESIPGVSCYQPAGALYLFPRLDPELYPVEDDQQFVIDFLEQQNVLVSHGSGFNLADTQHFRVVFLAPTDVLGEAIDRFAAFLATRD